MSACIHLAATPKRLQATMLGGASLRPSACARSAPERAPHMDCTKGVASGTMFAMRAHLPTAARAAEMRTAPVPLARGANVAN
eukprot:61919-Heterocapsa_arctica.AAC.1